jgi:hypothetical protein
MGTPATVVAQRFLLQDARGVVRAALGVNEQGEVLLALMDARGQARADIGVTADGLPRVELMDSAGNTRALVNVDPGDTPSIALFDAKVARAVVSVMDIGPYLALTDGQSRRQVTLAAGADTAEILFEDAGRPGSCEVGIRPDRSVGLIVYDGSQRPRVAALLASAGDAGITVADPQGRVTKLP